MAADRSPELSSEVGDVLSLIRRRIRLRILLDGLLIAALCVFSVFWLGGMLDYFPVKLGSNETPRWLRMGLLAIMGLSVAWALLWRMGRRFFARLNNRNLAVLLERHFPQLNNELVTAVELSGAKAVAVSNPQAYQAMLRRVQASASTHITQLDTSRILNWRPIWWLSAATALLVVMTLAFGVAQPAWLGLWSARLFTLSDERWPRQARLRIAGVQVQLPAFSGQLSADRVILQFVDNVVQVPRGGAVVLHAMADTTAPRVPELCTLFYQLEDGSRGRANMRRLGGTSDGWQPFQLDGPPLVDINSDVTFDIVGGDARLDDFQLKTVDPGVITVMQLDLTYPAYILASHADLPPREQVEVRSGQRIPEGTHVVLKGIASGPLQNVQYVVRSTQTSRSTGRSASATKPERFVAAGGQQSSRTSGDSLIGELSMGDGDIEVLSVKPQGQQFELPLGVLRDTVVVEIRLLDQYGLTTDQIARYVVSVVEDAQPEVEAKLLGIGTAVTPKAVLPIIGKARDDHGLDRVWATVVLNENPPLEIDVPVDADGKLEPRIDLLSLSETRGLKVATDSTLGLALSATDRFDLGGLKHTGSGQPFQLAVVTEDKLLVLLDRQELELRQRLELIISELSQLRDVLRELARPASTSSSVSANATQTAHHVPSSSIERRALHSGFASFRSEMAQPPAAADGPAEAEPNNPVADPEQARRMELLRAQQSVLQADKSQQELIGVATRVEEIRLQLINNRIDSIDRQARLHDRVYLPLQAMLANEMESFRNRLGQLQTAAMSPAGGTTQAIAAAEDNDRVLQALDAIVANMLDLESFNEIIDLVRGILDDEERLLDETQKKQKQDILDLLK